MRRYGPAELVGTVTAVIGASLALLCSDSFVVSAYIATMAENLGYYGTICVIDVLRRRGKNTTKLAHIRNWTVEFGASELLDTALTRPLCMYIFPLLLGSFQGGILVGKLAADIVFYLPTVTAYEYRKARWG